jgi:hypothetical protein
MDQLTELFDPRIRSMRAAEHWDSHLQSFGMCSTFPVVMPQHSGTAPLLLREDLS